MLTSLVKWVEKGQVSDTVIAAVRGAGNAAGANTDVPTTWGTSRTRPLCAYPKMACYGTSGSIDDAASFTCQSCVGDRAVASQPASTLEAAQRIDVVGNRVNIKPLLGIGKVSLQVVHGLAGVA